MSEPETEPVTDDPEPDTEPDTEPEPETEPEGRCEAETTVGGNLYRCALQVMHDGEHAFAQVDTGELLPEEPEAPGEAEMMAANKKVAASAQTYWASIRRNYGEDLGGFHECPLCVGYPPGLYWPAELPPEKAAALRQILGMPSLENYKRDNNYATCASCDGLGTVLTGSKVPSKMTAQCFACAGSGYIVHDTARAAAPVVPIFSAPANGGEHVPEEPAAFDPWGRPFGDPDYGRLPNFSGAGQVIP